MGMSDLETIIRTMRQDVDGDVCSRSRVMDALLDLRLEAGTRSDVTDLIDDALANLPGKTMVPADWWRLIYHYYLSGRKAGIWLEGRSHLAQCQPR